VIVLQARESAKADYVMYDACEDRAKEALEAVPVGFRPQ
jgi:hypothetical protein